jgi:hypothetical protein
VLPLSVSISRIYLFQKMLHDSALASKLGEMEPEKGNPYQRVYSRLYRTFSVSSYKAIPLEMFPAVMTWLVDWWKTITDETALFGPHDVGGQLDMGLG